MAMVLLAASDRVRQRLRQWSALLLTLLALTPAPAQAAETTSPELIYWRQNLLTVPYQWTSTSDSATAKSVQLYVSKDRGASWQPISDAQPQLLAFNYRAEADGEYWFSIRTTDSSGSVRLPPTGVGTSLMQPELRVVVDTSMPRIESLSGQLLDDDTLEVRWRVTDPHLSAHSCNVEVQIEGSTNWQPVPLTGATEVSEGTWEGTATFVVTTELPPAAIRATAIDLAGNRAVFQSAVAPTVAAAPFAARKSTASLGPAASEPGWVSNSAPSSGFAPELQPALPQLWAADRSASSTFDALEENKPPVVYGTPLGIAAAPAPPERDTDLEIPEPTREDRPLGNVPSRTNDQLEPITPFRQVSMSNARAEIESSPRTSSTDVPPLPSNPLARMVNSRSFALEYEVAEVGPDGVAKVEVWGTRDGGQSWQHVAFDDDNRSPVRVAVDDEGEYGFSIVVSSANGRGGSPPHPGDTPALWVNVDLQPPIAQILSVDTKRGDVEGELKVRWEADDDNLEPRPISLFYSSRPAGPWTTIATNLENVGQFDWPLERHVPRRIYLKLEARDSAGNVAEFQTSEAMVVEHEPAATNWLRLPPVK